jgi:hypothetical protein
MVERNMCIAAMRGIVVPHTATVLTLPTQPKTAAEAETQERVAYVG